MTSDAPKVWVFIGKLVAKRMFFRRGLPPILVVVFINEDGQLIDLLCFSSESKSYTVFRKVQENRCYKVRIWGQLKKPDPKYSSSSLETKSWYIDEEINGERGFGRFVDCTTNLQNTIEILKTRTANVLAVYKGHEEGPGKNFYKGEFKVQGYFVNLVDESGQDFNVLVWHTKATMKGSKFPLFRCKTGDTMLIPCARSSYLPPGSQRPYTLTSLYPPVIDSQCVESKRIIHLKRRFRGAS